MSPHVSESSLSEALCCMGLFHAIFNESLCLGCQQGFASESVKWLLL